MIKLPPATKTTLLQIGARVQGKFDSGFDQDWYRIDLKAGETVILNLLDSSQAGGSLSMLGSLTNLVVYDSTGNAVAGNLNAYGSALTVSWTATSAGSYYVLAALGDGYSGTYTLDVARAQEDSIPANATTTAVLQAGTSVSGNFDVTGDSDWYRFHVEAGKHYAFGSNLTDATKLIDSIVLRDAKGNVLDGVGYPYEPDFTGDIFVSVDGFRTGTYRLVSTVLADDYSANLSAPGVLTAGAMLQGEIQYLYDTDRFSFQVETGHYYTLKITAAADDLGRLVGQLRDQTLAAISSPLGSGQAGPVELGFVASYNGTYYLDVSHDGQRGGKTHAPYTVNFIHGGRDDYTDDPAYAIPLVLGQATAGKIQAVLDKDAFQATLEAGTTYYLEVTRAGTAEAERIGVKLAAADTDLEVSLSKGGTDGVYFTPRIAGAAQLTALLHSDTLNAEIGYAIKLVKAVDDYGANAEKAGKLAIGDGALGTLEYRNADRDWFAVDLKGGETYWFQCLYKQTNSTVGAGPRLRLIDASGKIVAEQGRWDYSDSIFSVKAASSGTYYLEVYGAIDGNMGASPYSVSARIGIADDYGSSFGNAGRLSLGATLSGNLEIDIDNDGFSLDVQAGSAYVLTLSSGGQGKTIADRMWNMDLSEPGNNYPYAYSQSQPNGDKIIVFQARTTGTLLLNVSGDDGRPTGAYTVKLEAGELNDLPSDTSTTASLTPAQTVSSRLSYSGDVDAVKVILEAGKTYAFDLLAAAMGGGTFKPTNHSVDMRGPGGAYVNASYDYAHDVSWRVTAATSGEYLIKVSDYSQTGSYTLRMLQISGDTKAPELLASPGASVGLRDNLVLKFNEPMLFKSGKPVLSVIDSGLTIGLNGGITDANLLWRDNGLVLDPDTLLQPGVSYQIDFTGPLSDYAGNAYLGPTHFEFSTVALAAGPTAGDDWFTGRGVGKKIDGGAGLDTVAYSMPSSAVSITRAGDAVSVKLNALSAGDTLTGIERLMFNDVNIALDINGVGGQAYRLYQAAFDRKPDTGGLGFWIGAMDRGASLRDVAGGFINSAEFQSLVGANATNAQFVDALYRNVLHRAADAGGAAYWLGVLEQGNGRADVLAAFSESAENQANVITLIGNGFIYT